MSITITYNAGIESNFGSKVGLVAYMDHYTSEYYSPSHAADMAFTTNPVGNIEIGDQEYTPTYPGITPPTAIIGKYLSNVSTADYVDFLITAANVKIEGDNDGQKTIDYIFYTGPHGPSHTLFGNIDSLVFGGNGFNSGTNKLNTELFTISGTGSATLGDIIGYGLLDNNSNGWYDEVLSRTSSSPDPVNQVHELVLDLMGGGISHPNGPYGPGSTSTLENILHQNSLVYQGTGSNEIFDSFAGDDLIQTGGGIDRVNFYEHGGAYFGTDAVYGFVRNSGDKLAFENTIFASASAAAAATSYNALINASVTQYTDSSSVVHTVYVMAAGGALTTSDFDIFTL